MASGEHLAVARAWKTYEKQDRNASDVTADNSVLAAADAAAECKTVEHCNMQTGSSLAGGWTK